MCILRWIIRFINKTMEWQFVDDTIGYVNNNSIDIILSKLNSFHPNIQFTYDVEEENKPSFLDVLLIRNGIFIETEVFRKPTNSDIYLNCNSFRLIPGSIDIKNLDKTCLFNLFIRKTPRRWIKTPGIYFREV